jgi:hypothetical protein
MGEKARDSQSINSQCWIPCRIVPQKERLNMILLSLCDRAYTKNSYTGWSTIFDEVDSAFARRVRFRLFPACMSLRTSVGSGGETGLPSHVSLTPSGRHEMRSASSSSDIDRIRWQTSSITFGSPKLSSFFNVALSLLRRWLTASEALLSGSRACGGRMVCRASNSVLTNPAARA